MGAERSQWQFPANEVGKVIGWSDEASPSNPSASKGLVNKGPFVEPGDIANMVETTDTDASGFGFVIDEDDMASDLDTKVPTQQSVKAYVDALVSTAGATPVATRTALKALAASANRVAILTEGGRFGEFAFVASDLSAEVTLDPEEGIYVAPDSDATGASGAWVRQFTGKLNACWWGAVGDDSTDNQSAVQAMVDFIIARGDQQNAAYFPAGVYRYDDEVDIYRANSPRIDMEFYGDGMLSTIHRANFFGADKALFRCVDPAFSTRASPTSFFNMGFDNVATSGGTNPVFIDVAGWGESRMEHVKFGASNNTHLRGGGMQNIRMVDVVSYYGGKFYKWKPTNGFTFSLSGSTLTASASIFTSDDVGMRFILNHSSGRRIYRIATYVDVDEVTVTSTDYRLTNVTDVEGWFEGAFGSITGGTNLLFTVSGLEQFTADDVGRTILVQTIREGTNDTDDNAIQRAKIKSLVGTHAIRLGDELGNDILADRTGSKVRFATPVFDFYQPISGGTLGAGSSDVQIHQLHIEHFFGVAVFCENVGEWTITGKIHGETSPTDTHMSNSVFWLNDAGFEFSGVMDSSAGMSRSRVYVSDQNKTARFKDVFNRNIINERFLYVEPFSDAGGYVDIDGIELANYAQTKAAWIEDQNSPPRTLLSGSVNMLGDSAAAKSPVLSGRTDTTNEAAIASTITWNSTTPGGTTAARYRWRQIGDMVFFSMRLDYATAGTTNSQVDIALPADMPTPAVVSGVDSGEMLAANVTGFMSAGKLTSPSLSKAFMRDDGSGGYLIRIMLNSSTISADLAVASGWYFTNA